MDVPTGFDPILHPPARFRSPLSWPRPRRRVRTSQVDHRTSDSVMSKHLAALSDAGYVALRKAASDGRQRTWARLTSSGRAAFRRPRQSAGSLAAAVVSDDGDEHIGEVQPGVRELEAGRRPASATIARWRTGATAAFPVRISRRRLLRRGDAAAKCRGSAGGHAEAACAARRFVNRPFERVVREELVDAGWARAGRPVRSLCAARRGSGGAGGGCRRRALHALDAQRLFRRGSG